jgi:hypothetical protein
MLQAFCMWENGEDKKRGWGWSLNDQDMDDQARIGIRTF